MLKKLLFSLAVAATTIAAAAQKPLTFEASYLGDTYYNTLGGLKTGGGYMGMGNIKVGLDTWKGASFFINGASIHGKSLTENYLGDLQVASNIDAGEHAYLHEFWFNQQLGKLSFTLGLQDLNAEFLVSEGAGEFLNSSFGVPPVIATGIPVPIFPLTGLGIAARYDFNDRWAVKAALFDGNQTAFDHNPHNVHWSFSKRDGTLSMGEIHFDGRYKIGAYYHSADKNYGLYAMVDQPLSERVGVFCQLAVAPKMKNDNNYSIGAGANFQIAERHQAGFALAHAGLHAAKPRHETALELYYKFVLSENICLQPDVQYIANPAGGDDKLNDALVGMLRMHVNF